ncbi:MAG TPA: hypothetical protein VHV77_18015, partial [Pirellulales bacterium]|nr:hypothetical protein [Pirellulales bacterium]
MRLTLRVMLAYVHGLFDPEVAEEVGRSISASGPASQILAQLKAAESFDAAAQMPSAEPGADANDVAEYLDNSLSVEKVIDFEQRCLASPWQLAELSAAHDIVVQILARPVDCDEALRSRIHALAAQPESRVVVEEQSATELPAREQLATQQTAQPLERTVTTPIAPRPILVRNLPSDHAVVHKSIEHTEWAVRTSEGEPEELDLSFNGLLDSLATKGNVRAWATSLVVHQILIILLGLWLVARHRKDDAISLHATSTIEEVLVATDLPVLRDMPPEITNLVAMVSMPQQAAAYTPTLPAIDSIARSPETAEAESRKIESLDTQSVTDTTAGPRAPARSAPRNLPQRERSDPTAGGIVAATDVNTAVDRITGGLRTELDAGDLLIVWLFDASLSLQDDRQQVAARLEPFYRQLDGRREQSHLLMNAAVAFGNTTVEL